MDATSVAKVILSHQSATPQGVNVYVVTSSLDDPDTAPMTPRSAASGTPTPLISTSSTQKGGSLIDSAPPTETSFQKSLSTIAGSMAPLSESTSSPHAARASMAMRLRHSSELTANTFLTEDTNISRQDANSGDSKRRTAATRAGSLTLISGSLTQPTTPRKTIGRISLTSRNKRHSIAEVSAQTQIFRSIELLTASATLANQPSSLPRSGYFPFSQSGLSDSQLRGSPKSAATYRAAGAVAEYRDPWWSRSSERWLRAMSTA